MAGDDVTKSSSQKANFISNQPSKRQKLVTRLTTALIVFLFAVALAVLDRLFASLTLAEVVRDFNRLPIWQLAVAIGLVAVNYLFLSSYDLIGFRFIGHGLPWKKLAPTSILGFVFANNLGFFGGAGIRFRFYTLLGLKPLEIAQVVGIAGLTYWFGFASLGGLVLLLVPISLPEGAVVGSATLQWIGAGLLGLLVVYFLVGWLGKNEIRVFGRRLTVPSPRLQLVQLAIASTDLILVSSILYFCLPPSLDVSYPTLLAAFVVAQVLGLLSHVPGGIGVFESILVFALQGPATDQGALLASLLVFRLIYYVAPLGLAISVTAVYELERHVKWIRRPRPIWVEPVEPLLVPILATATVFAAGATFLLCAAVGPRAALEGQTLAPLRWGLLEIAQPLIAFIGVALALLAPGLRMRREMNLKFSLALLGAGATLLYVSGFRPWVSSSMIGAVVVLLLMMDWYSKPNVAPIGTRESRDQELNGWFFAQILILVACMALSIFVHRPVDVEWSLLANFETSTQAGSFGRSLRSIASSVALVAIVWSILRMRRSSKMKSK